MRKNAPFAVAKLPLGCTFDDESVPETCAVTRTLKLLVACPPHCKVQVAMFGANVELSDS